MKTSSLILLGSLTLLQACVQQPTQSPTHTVHGTILEPEQHQEPTKHPQVTTYTVSTKLSVSPKEFHCLAKNIFHESGVESKYGKIAVAQVTLNRLKTGRWGKDICSVVYAKKQFSWTINKKIRNSIPKGKLWEESVEVAKMFVNGKRVRGLENSHFYHTDYIRRPYWADPSKKVLVVGQHIFYSEDRKI